MKHTNECANRGFCAAEALADAETLNAYINAKTDDGNAYTDNSDEAWFVRLRLGQMRVNRNPARALAAIPGLRGVCSGEPYGDGNGLGPDGCVYPGDPAHCPSCGNREG